MPTSYVNDFAHVLSPETQQKIEAECVLLHSQLAADVALVTIKTLDDDQSIEEFTADLEEKWKLGKSGKDRSAIFVIVLNPHKTRIETGYGLEAAMPDARVGRLLDTLTPMLAAGDYNDAATTGIQGIADEIAGDETVNLPPMAGAHQYHREIVAEPMPTAQKILYGVLLVAVVLFLLRTGNLGWGLLLLNMLSGGGGGGGGRDDEGGGFGGSGGGASGGGGASRDY